MGTENTGFLPPKLFVNDVLNLVAAGGLSRETHLNEQNMILALICSDQLKKAGLLERSAYRSTVLLVLVESTKSVGIVVNDTELLDEAVADSDKGRDDLLDFNIFDEVINLVLIGVSYLATPLVLIDVVVVVVSETFVEA